MPGLDVSALTAYVDQLSAGLAKAIVLEANTIKDNLITIEYGAKGDQYALNVLKFSAAGKTNDGCSTFASSGTTTFAQPKIKISPFKFEDSICINDLHKFYTAESLKASMNGEDLGSLDAVFMENKAETTSREIDQMIWRGAVSTPKYATGGTTGNLALMDGILQACYSNSATTVAELSKTAITNSNAYGVVDQIADAVKTNIPEILDEFNIYLAPNDFQSYLFSLRSLNLFNYNTESKGIKNIHHPGSIGCNVVKVNGLKGGFSGSFVATTKENVHAVFSDASDMSYEAWYDKPTDALNFRMKLRAGAGFFMPELVVWSRG